MKKLIVLLPLLFIIPFFSAQAWEGKGDQKIQVGINGWGFGNGLTGTYDYGITHLLSLGGGANFYFDGYDHQNNKGNFFLFGRLNAHLQKPLNLPSEWDIYPGLDLGFLGSDFRIGAHIGVRYYFNTKVGIFLEAGNNGSLGVSFNL